MITIRTAVAKRCPYKDEIDIGELVITCPGDAPELHALAKQVKEGGLVSHEQYTRDVLSLLPEGSSVTTHWHTGPWDVECSEGAAG
jgi:hypothetical protein